MKVVDDGALTPVNLPLDSAVALGKRLRKGHCILQPGTTALRTNYGISKIRKVPFWSKSGCCAGSSVIIDIDLVVSIFREGNHIARF